MLILHFVFSLGRLFDWEMEGNWVCVLHRSCSCNYELDVRFLNNLNWTFTAQVMVYFPGLPQLRLLICLFQDLGICFWSGNSGNFDSCSS